jgi:hypothetical protein
VFHGPRRRSYIEGVARLDEDDFEAVALGFDEQEMIVEPSCRGDLRKSWLFVSCYLSRK